MSLRNCERCGRLFSGVDPVCPACRETERAEFERVRAYLRAHPDVAVAQVSEATGVPVERLHRWAREGRLSLRLEEESRGALRCESCGVPIDTGRLCPRCAASLAHKARTLVGEPGGTGAAPAPKAEGAAGPPPSPGREPGSSGRSKVRVHVMEDLRRRFR